jgi:hypothetical protein
MRKLRDLLKPYRIDRPFSGGKLLFQLLMTFAWIGAWRFIQTSDPSPRQRLTFPFIGLFATGVFWGVIWIGTRKKPKVEPLDEMQRRIWLDSTEFSYRTSFLMLSTACLLQAVYPAISGNPFYRLSWLVLPISQTLGAWIAYRRYR